MTEDQEIEFIIEEDENELNMYSYISNYLCFEYFVGYEITALLGYKDTNKTIRTSVSKCNQLEFRDYPGVKEPKLDPRVILITRDGAVEILLKTRKRISPDVLHILKKFNIDTTNRKCLTKEQQTLSSITDVFKTEKFEDQFKIGPYYLDLYFSEHKIINECDENGHADRKPYKERERMDYVNKTLEIDDSHWIRFNPDAHDFDITKVIGQIYRKIDEIKDKKNKEEIKLLEEEKKQLLKTQSKKSKNKSSKIVYQQSDDAPTLMFIDDHRTDKKKCTKCLLLLPLYDYYLDKHVDEKDFNLDNEDENEKYKELKYRSQCKKCYNEEIKIFRDKVREDPNYNRKECKDCDTLLKYDMFYKNEDGIIFDNCKECYKIENNLVECKQCNLCKKILDFSKFQKDLAHRDGMRSQCRDCRNEKAKNNRNKKKDETDEKVMCEFCDKEISSKNNLLIHQNTKVCQQKQGFIVELKKHPTVNFRSKIVIQYDMNTKDEIQRYNSVAEASKETNILRTSIEKVCKGQNKTGGGFIWKYATTT